MSQSYNSLIGFHDYIDSQKAPSWECDSIRINTSNFNLYHLQKGKPYIFLNTEDYSSAEYSLDIPLNLSTYRRTISFITYMKTKQF